MFEHHIYIVQNMQRKDRLVKWNVMWMVCGSYMIRLCVVTWAKIIFKFQSVHTAKLSTFQMINMRSITPLQI